MITITVGSQFGIWPTSIRLVSFSWGSEKNITRITRAAGHP